MAARSSALLRRRLVLQLERKGCITSAPVGDAFLAVPRERFLRAHLEQHGLEAVYRDEAILTRRGSLGQPLSSSSQPAIMALMLERLELFPGARVLEIGAGTGYNAALLATIVGPGGSVVSVELDPATASEARNALRDGGHDVRVVVGDGRGGFPPAAPYDRVVVTASAGEVARAWHEQLAPGGLLQAPLWVRGPELQLVTTLRREQAGFRSLSTLVGAFMPLRGRDEPLLPRIGIADAEEDLAALQGPALERMTGSEREQLASIVLGTPRVRRLDATAAWPLWFFLRLMTPSRQLVWGSNSVGIAAAGGGSLALLDRGGAPRRSGHRWASIRSFGTDEAESRLLELAGRWRARGCPGDGDLEIMVRLEGERLRLRRRWRSPA